MSASERNFSSFYLGDNVYQLAEGVIPQIAERLDVPLGQEPNTADLQLVMDKVGPNKVLRDNQEIEAIDRETMAQLLELSGIQLALCRSLWTPESLASPDILDAIVIMGGVANWQDRTAKAIHGFQRVPVYSAAGERPMDSPTEVVNPYVEHFKQIFKRYPKESEYAAGVIATQLAISGFNVMPSSYETKDGNSIMMELLHDNPHLINERVAMARVANAGIIMAIQMREAARQLDPEFDSDPKNPQVYAITDTFSVSRTEEGDKKPEFYQKASTGLRQLVLTAKKLHETAGGE